MRRVIFYLSQVTHLRKQSLVQLFHSLKHLEASEELPSCQISNGSCTAVSLQEKPDPAGTQTRAQQPASPRQALNRQGLGWKASWEASTVLLWHVLDTSFHLCPFQRAVLVVFLVFVFLLQSPLAASTFSNYRQRTVTVCTKRLVLNAVIHLH